MEPEDFALLDGVLDDLEKEGLFKDHWQLLRKFPGTIRSSKMVKHLLAKGACKSEEEAVALGQRLLDAQLIKPAQLASKGKRHHFSNARVLYRLAKSDLDLQPLNRGAQFELQRRPDVIMTQLDIQGAQRIVPCYVVLIKPEKRLNLYRSQQLQKPVRALDLSQAAYFLTAGEVERHGRRPPSASVGGGAGGEAKQQHVRAPSAPVAGSASEVQFLHLFFPDGPLKFRIETPEVADKLKAALKEMGVKLMEEAEVEDMLDDQAVLDLRDVLDTPAFRAEFMAFLGKNLALENLKFMEAVEAYRLINDNAERKAVAEKIFKLFVAKDAPELVNLDSKSFAEVKERIEQQQFRKSLFDSAYDCVYKMVARDVYMRFVRTPEYAAMIANQNRRRAKSASSPVSPRSAGEVSPRSVTDPRARAVSESRPGMSKMASFYIPKQDDVAKLREIVAKCRNSDIVQTRRVMLKKYDKCFPGSALVSWILSNDYASIRPVAHALGQSMVDCGLLWRVRGGSDEFLDEKDELYTFEPPEFVEKGLTYADLVAQLRLNVHPEYWFEGSMLLKGASNYNKVNYVCNMRDNSLTIYRGTAAVKPIRLLDLKETRPIIDIQEAKADLPAFAAEEPAPAAAASDTLIRYVIIGNTTFRIETDTELKRWQLLVQKYSQ